MEESPSEINGSIGNRNVTLPLTAIAVKVTNLVSPYRIRIYDVKDYHRNSNAICGNLMHLCGEGYFKANFATKPTLGSYVIMNRRWNVGMGLPYSFSRGILVSENDINSKYRVLLVDYGICVDLDRKGFVVIPDGLSFKPHGSFTVCIHNILPCSIVEDTESTEQQCFQRVSQQWSESSVQFMRELITASEGIYFEQLHTDESNVKYGELYLDMGHEIIRLSDALVSSGYAVRIDESLSRFICKEENPSSIIVDKETLYCFNATQDNSELSDQKCIKSSVKNTAKCYKYSEGDGGYSKRYAERERQKVLIFSKINSGFLTSLGDAKFPTQIHRAWNDITQSSRLKKIQAYTWPAIREGLDVLAVGTKNSGKTLGTLTAVCALLAARKNIPKGKEPVAIILCASSLAVSKVYALCSELLIAYPYIKLVATNNGKTDCSIAANIYNGCQILITTPNYFARFMNRNTEFLTFKELRFLVFDDADVILDKYLIAVKHLFDRHGLIRNKIGIRRLEGADAFLQTIMTARQCNSTLKEFTLAHLKLPYICITSFIEAAIFKSVRPKLYLMKSEQKNRKLLELLTDDYKKSRTVVFCVNGTEAKELNDFLSGNKETLLAHEEMNIHHLEGIKSRWNASIIGSYPILICTDGTLPDLNITNAECLIHYSISLRFQTLFNYRFSVLHDNLLQENCTCNVTIFANENNDVQFQSVVSMMERMKLMLSPQMKRNVELLANALEHKKSEYPVCNRLKSFGICPEKNSCSFRHCFIPKIDDPITDVKINDKIKVMVMSIHDASHMSARITSIIRSDTQEHVTFPSTEYITLFAKMREYYSKNENRRRCQSLNIGDICAYEESLDDFKRVEIIRIAEEEGEENRKYIDVRCIDNGIISRRIQPHTLLDIPPDLLRPRRQAVEIFLSDVVPPDEEYSWDVSAIRFVHEWFRQYMDERSYVIGTVKLHLGNTIWVDTLEIGTQIAKYRDLIRLSLKEELIKNEYAVLGSNHMNQLYELSVSAGYPVDGFDTTSIIDLLEQRFNKGIC